MNNAHLRRAALKTAQKMDNIVDMFVDEIDSLEKTIESLNEKIDQLEEKIRDLHWEHLNSNNE